MDDLISRQAAIDALHGYFDEMLETDTWSPCDVYGLIEILPSADAEPVRHGRWIEEPNCMYRCSSCGSHYPSIRGYMYYCYCPSCGTRME